MGEESVIRYALSQTLNVNVIDSMKLYDCSIDDALRFLPMKRSALYLHDIIGDILQKQMCNEAAALLHNSLIKFHNYFESQNITTSNMGIPELLDTLKFCLHDVGKEYMLQDSYRVASMIFKRFNRTDIAPLL